ncbi:MAG TPA: lipopolysaccharide kinase InaA family protein [Magnetospirillum sp.]|nr:lipopolysaccharide kinase InaA family protein [Magnetospirillum sp.]
MPTIDQARALIAQGRPRAAARLLLAAGGGDARAVLDSLPVEAPHGAVLAERLRFGPPETWRGWRPGYGAVAIKLWPPGEAPPLLPPVSHPGVAPLLDQGDCWRVFAWIAGPTLAAVLRQQPLEREVVVQIAEAIEALHRAGLAHGDLNPANIVLRDGDGRAVLIDWGEDCAGTVGWCPEEPHDAMARDHFALRRLRTLIAAPPAGGRCAAERRFPPALE